MRSLSALVIAGVLLVGGLPPLAGAGDEPASCPRGTAAVTFTPSVGRKSLLVSGTTFLSPGREPVGFEPPLIAAAMGKGRRGRMLMISATVSSPGAGYPPFSGGPPAQTGGQPMWPVVSATVNEIAVEDVRSIDCGGSGLVPTPPYCLLEATWWADLDVLEEAFPGRLIDKRLCVRLHGRDFKGEETATFVHVTLRAVQVSK